MLDYRCLRLVKKVFNSNNEANIYAVNEFRKVPFINFQDFESFCNSSIIFWKNFMFWLFDLSVRLQLVRVIHFYNASGAKLCFALV